MMHMHDKRSNLAISPCTQHTDEAQILDHRPRKPMDRRASEQLNNPIVPPSKRDDEVMSKRDDSDDEASKSGRGPDDSSKHLQQQQQLPILPPTAQHEQQGSGQYQYPQQPSYEEQQQAYLFEQQQQQLYQAAQQHQQQQQQQQHLGSSSRGGRSAPQTPQMMGGATSAFGTGTDTGFQFGSASSSFSAELVRHLTAGTPIGGGAGGAFGSSFGQTPLTGASFGSQTIGGGNRGSSSAFQGGGMGMGMGVGGGIMDSLAGIQPTPISYRGRGPQGSQHMQQQQQQQLMAIQQKLESVNEEDPSMLQYESRLADQSPLMGGGGPTSRESVVAEALRRVRRDSAGEGSGNESEVREGSGSVHLDVTRDSQQVQKPPASQQPQDQLIQADQLLPPLGGESSPQPPLPLVGGTLNEFPFVFDGYAAWVCRHCQHVPPYYRGGNYVWQASQPPPNHFVDMHLRFCPGLNPHNMPPTASQQMQALASEILPYPLQQTMQQNPGFETDITPRGKDPPRGQDPPGKKSFSPQRPGEGGDDKGVSWGGTQSSSSLHDSFQYPYHPYAMGGLEGGNPFPQLQDSSLSPQPEEEESEGGKKKKKRKTKGESSNKSPKGRRTDDITYKAAIEFLKKETIANKRPLLRGSDVGQSLIVEPDADLLTDYFYHMMQQLAVCRFSEKDRKTRGGKRENINIGYGGLQCLHCIDAPAARKFYWSTVDRLANSFAEIPTHVLKCKSCPDNIKDALLALKGRHSDQMQILPRGSQKVFFRRMWRRLHDGDTEMTPLKALTVGKDSLLPSTEARATAAADHIAKEAALKSPAMAAPAAASALALSAKKLELQAKGDDKSPSPQKVPLDHRVLLAIPEDKDWLSDMDCFVRNQIEVFSSKHVDVDNAAADRKYPIKIGQVGIRCVHCAMSEGGARAAAVSYPYSISGIYESVREFQRLHLENCKNIPKDLKATSGKLGTASSSLSSVLRRYYVQAARALGLFDTEDNGIRAGGTATVMSSAGFQASSAISSLPRPTIPAVPDAPGLSGSVAIPAFPDAPGLSPVRGDSQRASFKRKASEKSEEEEPKPEAKRIKSEDEPSSSRARMA